MNLPSTIGIRCEHCGSTPENLGDTTWRMAVDHWQHRCLDAHPQVGHWRVDPIADTEDVFPAVMSLEGLRQIQPLDEAFVAELRKQMQEHARQWQHLAWALDAHLGAPLDVTSQDILETIKRLASDGNALWAKVERKVEP